MTDVAYAEALRERLERNGAVEVCSVETPDPQGEGVIVVDSAALERLPAPLAHPERIVLITRNDPQELSRAWNAGIRSVVFCNDPLSTAVLAVMAAALRCGQAPRGGPTRDSSTPAPGTGQGTLEQNGRKPKAPENRGASDETTA
ncbi:MAG: hypothetical protein NZ554_13830 [Bryobacteraceae bacterium]|nr:hypothetical protein [Bryobacteraceae bacterium]